MGPIVQNEVFAVTFGKTGEGTYYYEGRMSLEFTLTICLMKVYT
jgi:hypothetical protein